MSRYHHNKVTHELEPIAGYGSRVATSVDGKTLTVHSSLLNIDGYNYGSGDIGAAINMIATIESGMVATKDYDAGECFVYNAILYVVTEDVEDGDEFVIGENCALAPTLSEQILAANDRTDTAIIKADNAAGQLVVDGTKFYFDSHDGKYGYNTSAARGADTFVPFNDIESILSNPTVIQNNNASYIAPSGVVAAIVGFIGYYTGAGTTSIKLNGTDITLSVIKRLEYNTNAILELGIVPTCEEGDTITFPNANQTWENHFVLWLS